MSRPMSSLIIPVVQFHCLTSVKEELISETRLELLSRFSAALVIAYQCEIFTPEFRTHNKHNNN